MKKSLYLLGFAVFLYFSISSMVYAQQRPSTGTYKEGLDVHDQSGAMSNPVLVEEIQNNTGSFWLCQMGEKAACPESVTSQQSSGIPYVRNSLMGKVADGIALLYAHPPANTQMYLADLGARAGIIRPTYAQGIGFAGLSPLLGVWRAFRNIAYGFLIIVMVVIGFAVMFRTKIDPRTVISVQSALPNIVVTLILITFSYAIVGLVIDFMYILIFLFMTTMAASGILKNLSPEFIGYYTGGPLSNLFGAMFSAGTPGIGAVYNMISLQNLNAITALVGAGVGIPLIASGVGAPLGILLIAVGVGGPLLLVSLLVWIALLFAYFRILLTLLGAYIQVILALIFGPLQIMFGAIPNSDAFWSWMRNLFANIIVFPLTSALLIITMILTGAAFQQFGFWVPPGLGGEQGAGVAGIIGLGMALTIPNIVNSIKEAMKAKPAVQAGLAPLFAPIGTLTGGGMQLLQAQYYFGKDTWLGRGLAGLLKKLGTRGGGG